jgi:hypothetical protein
MDQVYIDIKKHFEMQKIIVSPESHDEMMSLFYRPAKLNSKFQTAKRYGEKNF